MEDKGIMQAPTSDAVITLTRTDSPWPVDSTGWLTLLGGFVLLGIAASLLTSQLRTALPEHPFFKKLHAIYPSIFGAGFASAAPFALPGFGIDSRWLLGILAPYLWAPLYEVLKRRYEKQLGVTLPGAGELTRGVPPAPNPTPGGNNAPPA